MSRYRIILLFTFLLAVASAGIAADKWKPLKKDGIHDPANPAIKVLQEPADALSVLQVDTAGNMVDWARSLEYGFIKPRGSIDGKYEAEVLESTVLMTNTRPLRYVRFPHKTHTQWMSCRGRREHDKHGEDPEWGILRDMSRCGCVSADGVRSLPQH